jgi:hypothetical protein
MVTLAVCEFALKRSGLISPLTDEATKLLRERRPIPPRLEADLEDLVERLDAEYFGKRDETAILLFHKARAAAALLFACEDDALHAASEAFYEANAATDDTQALKAIVVGTLGRP